MIDWSPGHLSNKIPKDFTQEAGDGHLLILNASGNFLSLLNCDLLTFSTNCQLQFTNHALQKITDHPNHKRAGDQKTDHQQNNSHDHGDF